MKNTQRIAVAGGIMWSLTMFITTLLSVSTGYAEPFLNAMASIYPGYTISVGGSVVGLIYGFCDVFIGVYIFAFIYDRVDIRG